MNKEDSCMLQEITSFLIKVGEHCLSCEGKPIELEKQETIKDVTVEKELQKFGKYIKPKNKYTRHKKICYLEKWITKGNFTVFTLDQFYKAYPRQRENKNLDRNIIELIKAKKIIQMDKDKFSVIRRK